MKKERGIHELYADDPGRADWQVFGRKSHAVTRRGFIKGLSAMAAVVGGHIVFNPFMPGGLIPAALADSNIPFAIDGKDGLTILNDRPVNAETPVHLLNDDITPAKYLFVRNNGVPPENPDASTWTMSLDGESCVTPKTYSIADLKSRFEIVTLQLTLECAGNGRSEFYPPAKGNQWTLGAVGCPSWTGVRLRDVLADCGYKDAAVYVAYYGADAHLSFDATKDPISRGVPMRKALEGESLIAWNMNGQPLPAMNGYPLRLVFGGWPGSTSGKWLDHIVIRDRVHDGTKMTGKSYRVPCDPVAPGADVADEDMCIIESLPVKSLITSLKSGAHVKVGDSLHLHGHAWAGDNTVAAMDLSVDFGQTWQRAELVAPANRLAWQNWDHTIRFERPGYYEVWARATDDQGVAQPMVLPGWNPKGYLNNAAHRVALAVE